MAQDLVDEDMPELVRRFFQGRQLDGLGEIVRRHYSRLRDLARRRLEREQIAEAVYEPDEALNSTLDKMIRLVLSGRVESIEGVDGFWRLYRRILAWKIMTASDRHDALKRGGPGIRKVTRNGEHIEDLDEAPATLSALVPDDLDLFKSNLFPAEVLAISKEVTDRLLELLQPDLKTIVRWRLDGRTIPYMAAALGVSPRSVDRMLEMIRRIWASSGLLDGIEPWEGIRDRKA
jgi:flagellar biosynthesis/type III secretory pathway chaperone